MNKLIKKFQDSILTKEDLRNIKGGNMGVKSCDSSCSGDCDDSAMGGSGKCATTIGTGACTCM